MEEKPYGRKNVFPGRREETKHSKPTRLPREKAP